MKIEDVEFWRYILLENADFLFRKKQIQGGVFAISTDEIIQETINHSRTTLGQEITDETAALISQIFEKCIGKEFWQIKAGYVIPAYYLADLFLIKANELFSEEGRRYKSVLHTDELIAAVIDDLHAILGAEIDEKIKATLHPFLDTLCNQEHYFKNIQQSYIIFDNKGKERLKKILPVTNNRG
ncbi:MAG: hypothetical protein ACTSRS_10065 [Candidatus Helarchaeota archaeon]